MNEFKTKLENLLKEACIVFEKQGLPYQSWHKLDRKEKSGTAFSEEQVAEQLSYIYCCIEINSAYKSLTDDVHIHIEPEKED